MLDLEAAAVPMVARVRLECELTVRLHATDDVAAEAIIAEAVAVLLGAGMRFGPLPPDVLASLKSIAMAFGSALEPDGFAVELPTATEPGVFSVGLVPKLRNPICVGIS